jgi:thiol-disulfide isomerase/thioredoxin
MRSKGALSRCAGALAFGLLAAAPASATSLEVKKWSGPTPALRLQDLESKPVDIAALKGRAVIVNFWATWCEPCREEMPALERLRAKLRGRPFELLMVNFGESPGTVTRFLARQRLSLPVVLDPEKKVAEEWKVRGLPMTFLVDAEGNIRFWTFGEHDWSEGEPYKLVEGVVEEAQHARR